METDGIFSNDLTVKNNKIIGLMYRTELDDDPNFADFETFNHKLEVDIFLNTSNERDFIITVNFHVFMDEDENLDSEESDKEKNDEEEYIPKNELGLFLEGRYEIGEHVKASKVEKIIETVAIDNMLQYLRQCYNSIIRNNTSNNSYLPPFDLDKLHKDIKKNKPKSKKK